VEGEWRRLHNDELHNLHILLRIIRVIKSRRMRWVGHLPHMGEMINAYRIFVGKPEGTESLGGLRDRWEDNVRMDLGYIGWEVVDLMHLVQERDQWWAFVNMVLNFQFP
jgi:hypothetical protein